MIHPQQSFLPIDENQEGGQTDGTHFRSKAYGHYNQVRIVSVEPGAPLNWKALNIL
jgi:hypothetical protein